MDGASDGKILDRHEVHLWRVSDGQLRTIGDPSEGNLLNLDKFDSHKGFGAMGDVVFSPDGALLATGSTDGFFLWRVSEGVRVFKHEGKDVFALALAFSPDGSLLASTWSSEEGGHGIVLWSSPGREKLAALGGGPSVSATKSLSFSPNGKFLASADANHIRLWRVSDGKQVINRETPTKFFGSDSINSVSFSPNGAWLAAACGDHLVRIWPVLWPTGQ
ncbi:MAG: hypothetical protein WCD63_21045 [Terrimicrobiaceae bacterium]